MVEELEHRIHTYEERDAVECPKGFEENRGHIPHFPIVVDRFTMQAHYIKYIDQGCVMGTVGGPNDAIFIQDLYATSHIDADHVPNPLPAWFLTHIQGHSDTYPLIIREVLAAGNWGVHADVQWYYCTDAHLLFIEEEISMLQAQSEALCAKLRCTRFRLENADVPHCFSNRRHSPLLPVKVRVPTPLHALKPPNPSTTSKLVLSPMVGLLPNQRVMTLAILSGPCVVDGYIRVGPNWWSRCSDVRDDAR